MKKNLISLSLTTVLVVSCFAACGETKVSDETVKTAETLSEGDVTAAEEDTPVLFTSSISYPDLEGETLKVYTSNHINGWTNNTIINHSDEEDGEVVNDALFARDRFVEEKLNIKLEYTIEGTGNTGTQLSKLQKSITSGDDMADLIILDHAVICAGLAMKGMIYPLNHIDTIDLSAGYWMPELNDRCRIGNSLYFASCAISPRYYSSVYVTGINRDIAADMGLEDVYEVVKSGRWTFDKMIEMAKKGARDLDGDTDVDTKDQIGLMYGSLEGYVLGAGMSFLENRDGKLYCMFDDSDLINYMEHCIEGFQEFGVFNEGRNDIDWDGVIRGGRCLFWNPCTSDLTELRDLEYDYGILPQPKRDEAQDGYIGFSQPWINVTPMIPVTVEKLSDAGVLTDAMAAYGYDYIRPAVFDNVIMLKGTRDDQSAQIVDLIFQNITFDLSIDIGLSSINQIVSKSFATQLGKQSVSSLWAAQKDKINSQIQSLMDSFAEHESDLGIK